MTPDIVYDQLIGMGCARKLVFSWGGNPGVGSLHRLRDAVQSGLAGAARARRALACGDGRRATRRVRRTSRSASLRGYTGTQLAEHTASIASVTCPFTGEELAAVKALRPDVGIIHAQQADESGNVQMWGITGVQKEAVLASRRAIVTVEEIVPELELRPGGVVSRRGRSTRCASPPAARIPRTRTTTTTATTPSTSTGTRSAATATCSCDWMRRHVLETADVDEYHAVAAGRGMSSARSRSPPTR